MIGERVVPIEYAFVKIAGYQGHIQAHSEPPYYIGKLSEPLTRFFLCRDCLKE
eukprot:SAG31_NODE_439_length_15675_cov_6.578390_4_plen_53_part_00